LADLAKQGEVDTDSAVHGLKQFMRASSLQDFRYRIFSFRHAEDSHFCLPKGCIQHKIHTSAIGEVRARGTLQEIWEDAMLRVNTEKIGNVVVVHCEGRVVQSPAAFKLRDAVTQQKDAQIILLDLSDVQSLESGGLGMLVFLQRWASDNGIQFKVFEPPAFVRQRLERVRSASELEIAGMSEVLALLGWEPRELWDGIRRAA
jgi:anti-anti-sigma factor